MGKVKICFLIGNLMKGGAERVIVQLASRFSDDGYDVTVITSYKGENEYPLPQKIKRIVLAEKSLGRNKIYRNLQLIQRLRKIIKEEKFTVLISFMQESNFRAIISTIGLKTRCIVSVRNDPDMEYAGRMGNFIGKHILPLADACVFQTEDAKSWFPDKLQKKSKIIYNAVSESFYDTKYEPGFDVITVGRLSAQKNQKMLIDGFAEIKDCFSECNLLIYGAGELEKELDGYIKKRGLENRVVLMGTSDNIAQVLSTARVFVLTSDYEGMPNVLLEAMAVGVPIIATDCPCGGPRMIIEQNKNGILIPVGDTKQLAKQIARVLDDEMLCNSLSIKAKRKAQEYKPRKVYGQWKSYIETILDGR